MSNKPTYSICMCNYNMADTLERSLTSLLTQLDDEFEVVLINFLRYQQRVKIQSEMIA